MRVKGLGFRVRKKWGFGFGVEGSGFRGLDSWFKALRFGVFELRVPNSRFGFRVYGLGCRVQGLKLRT